MILIKKANLCAPQGCATIGLLIFRVEIGVYY